MAHDGPYLNINVGGIQRSVSDVNGVFNRSAQLQIPRDFPLDRLRLAQVDL